jgi:hypothetical protein
VKQVANDSAAQGELIMTGNCNEIRTVMMTKHATVRSARLRGILNEGKGGKGAS